MKRRVLIPAALLAIALAPACTNKQAETEQPVTITVDLTDQTIVTNINGATPPIRNTTMTLHSQLKNPTAANPLGMADCQMSYYIVHYHRNDGGTRLPPDQTFADGGHLPTPGILTLTNFPILSQSALQGSPFSQFVANGGIDPETGKTEIDLFYDITFFGQTVAGQRVQSETATGTKIFVFF